MKLIKRKQIIPVWMEIELVRFFDKKEYIRKKKIYDLTQKIIIFLESELQKNNDQEKQQVLKFLKKRPCVIFPYDFIYKYYWKDIEVHSDLDCGMKYVCYNNKRLYFPQSMNVKQIQGYYNWLLVEQDINSPHCYQTENFQVQQGDVVADLGAAEGLFPLMVIDKAKEIHLVECDQRWIAALKKTFEPWKKKVKIINKYVSDASSETDVIIDEYFNNNEVNFIKADIEGAEVSMLKGATSVLRRANVKLALCTYHKQNDAEELNEILMRNGFATEFSKGYMVFPGDDIMPPYLRKGLIRAKK